MATSLHLSLSSKRVQKYTKKNIYANIFAKKYHLGNVFGHFFALLLQMCGVEVVFWGEMIGKGGQSPCRNKITTQLTKGRQAVSECNS
jgi:hypothetical protein